MESLTASTTPQTREAIIDGNTGEFWKEANKEDPPFVSLEKDSAAGEKFVTFQGEPKQVLKSFDGGEPRMVYEVEVRTLDGIGLLSLTSKRLRIALRQTFPEGKLTGKKAKIVWQGRNQARKYRIEPQSL